MIIRDIFDILYCRQAVKFLIDDNCCIYSGTVESTPYWIAEMELPAESIEAHGDVIEIYLGE